MFLALREMRRFKGRYALIVALITLICYLIFFLTSLAYGLATANRTLLDSFQADGVVLSTYANQSIVSSSLSEDEVVAARQILRKAGVGTDDISEVSITPTVVELGGDSEATKENVVLVGLSKDSFLTPELVEGRRAETAFEVVASESLREEKDLKLGDKLQLSRNGFTFTVVGFTPSTKLTTAPAVFTERSLATRAFEVAALPEDATELRTFIRDLPDFPASVVVWRMQPDGSRPGAAGDGVNRLDLTALADPLEAEEMQALTITQAIWAIPGYGPQVATFGIMIGFLVVICAVVIGIFMYILTMQKRSLFGVLKAQGIPAAFIARSVLAQTALVSLVGIGIGLALTLLSAAVLPAPVPVVNNWLFYAGVALAVFLVAGVAAHFSVRQVLAVDPLDAIE